MPIPVKCQCGLVMEAPDEMAGQPCECPECKTQFLVPAPKAATAAVAASAAPKKRSAAKKKKQKRQSAAAPSTGAKKASDPSDMGSLLDEVGVQKARGKNSCPNCRAKIAADATICIHCGTNQESGKQVKQKLYGSAGGDNVEKSPTMWDDPKVKYGTLLVVGLAFAAAIYFAVTTFG